MPRTFAYVRVSTTSQTTDNQIQEIEAAGFKVEPRRVVTETISGSVVTARRRGLTRLLDRAALLEAVRNGSAATWAHFNLHGEFDFSDERMVDLMSLTPPKNPSREPS